MTLDQLVYFLETARSLHFGRAAETLNVSSSTISHSIKALEKELGGLLFGRAGKTIYLNDKGKKLFDRSTPLVNEMHSLKEDMLAPEDTFRGHLSMGSCDGLGNLFLLFLWSQYQKKRPLLTMKHQVTSRKDLETSVLTKKLKFDFLLTLPGEKPSDPKLDLRILHQEVLCGTPTSTNETSRA